MVSWPVGYLANYSLITPNLITPNRQVDTLSFELFSFRYNSSEVMSLVGERKSTLLATKFLTILGDPQETFFYQINCFRVERVSVNFSSLLHASKKNFAIFYTFFKRRFIFFNIPKKTGNKYCMAT